MSLQQHGSSRISEQEESMDTVKKRLQDLQVSAIPILTRQQY